MEDTTLGVQLEYCACFTNPMSKEMTLEEAAMLSLDIMTADDDEQGEKVLLANEKARKLIAQRMPPAFMTKDLLRCGYGSGVSAKR